MWLHDDGPYLLLNSGSSSSELSDSSWDTCTSAPFVATTEELKSEGRIYRKKKKKIPHETIKLCHSLSDQLKRHVEKIPLNLLIWTAKEQNGVSILYGGSV